MRKVKVSAPSNIALIKYMGKTSASDNRPTNSSLSLTLPHLLSWVELEEISSGESDRWEPLAGYPEIELSEKGRNRFLQHAKFLKNEMGIQGSFVIRSANDFPGDCGLASSASSFAALTMAFHQLSGDVKRDLKSVAQWSRQGSGSSCRSFFSPWAVWSGTDVCAVDLPLSRPIHQVIVVQSEKKEVSSSDAHRRVSTSALFQGRPERAEKRLESLLSAFRSMEWKKIYEICWAEFFDMHALFETSDPPFGYFEVGTMEVLKATRMLWQLHGDGPVVTMDAGPNVHLLWRPDQEFSARIFESTWKVRHRVISSEKR